MTANDILNGTDSAYLKSIQTRSTKLDGDPTIKTFFKVLPYDGRYNNTIEWEVFSGNVNPDKGRNILRYNGTEEYITTEKYFYHVDSDPSRTGIQTYRKNPWNVEIYTAGGTEGTQFMPNMNGDDDLNFYSFFIGGMINVDYKGVDSIYGLKGYVFQTPISLYEQRDKQKISGVTLENKNPYHNYVYDHMFNVSSVFGMPYFATEAMFSRIEGKTDKLESDLISDKGISITGDTYYNDHIICEPYSGIVIRSDISFQTNFLYDSWSPENYKEYLMPHILYQKRQDIDGVEARKIFGKIELLDERMKLALVVCIILGAIFLSAGASLFILTCFRNRERMKLLNELRKEEALKKKATKLKKKRNRSKGRNKIESTKSSINEDNL
jgi:hypothetical protein